MCPTGSAASTELTPCDRPSFAKAMTPALALVGGTGMTEAARREWLNAAYLALDGVPADLIERGARAAMLSADHPAKIVPAIVKEIGSAWELRRRFAKPIARPEPEALPAPDPDREEVGELMRGLVRKLSGSTE